MIRLAKMPDIDTIMIIINEAIKDFKVKNIDQWQNGYPNYEVIYQDIQSKEAYVLLNGEDIIGYGLISKNVDDNYINIYNGNWLTNNEYLVIHRLVISGRFKGQNYGNIFIECAKNICLESNIFSIKVDTHIDNKIMIKFLMNNNFKYTGIIKLEDNSFRNAYEYLV